MSLISAIKAPLGISNAIKKASQVTGADFSYLLKTAARESGFKKTAKAKTSSAAGLFQFIESTWLKTVKDAGNKFGLSKYTPHIFKTRSGRHYVPNPKLRQEILQLRHNPEVSAVMAGAFTQKNSEFVASELGREPTPGELYIAHFLGPKGASDLISLAEKHPNARADRHFRRAARANKSIFYSRGRPRSAAQVYNELVSDHAKLQTVAANPVSAASKPAVVNPAKSAIAKPAIETAKQTAQITRQAPVQKAKADLQAPLPAQKVASSLPDEVKVKEAVGLLGQKGSPIAPMTKVASLTRDSHAPAPKTLSDAAPGSVGIWTTNVRLPADETAGTESSKKVKTEEPALVKRRAASHRQRARSNRLLDVSAKRNTRPAPIRTASAANRISAANFWEQVSLNGN